MYNHLKKMVVEWNALKSDRDRFRYLIDHRGVFKLFLDNDLTYIDYSVSTANSFSEAEIEELPALEDFDDYLGWSDGVLALLDVIGLPAESV